jgi:hypothetical protein
MLTVHSRRSVPVYDKDPLGAGNHRHKVTVEAHRVALDPGPGQKRELVLACRDHNLSTTFDILAQSTLPGTLRDCGTTQR